MVIIIVAAFILFMIVCYRRVVRRQLSQEINGRVDEIVNQYITMYESGKFQQEKDYKEMCEIKK